MTPLSWLLVIAYPLTLHLLLIAGKLDTGLWLLLLITTLHALTSHGRGRLAPLLIASIAVVSLHYQSPFALYLPPLLIYGGLLIWFGSTLLPGREALLTRMARIVFDDERAETRDYTRGVTWLWTGLFLVMAVVTLGLTLFAPLETWSLFANILNYLITAAVALTEYGYRLWRFRTPPTRERLRRLLDRRRMGEWVRGE